MRTRISKGAPMSAAVTVLTCTPISAAATPFRWKADTGWSMSVPTSWVTSTFCAGVNIQIINAGWASMTALDPVA